MIDELRLGWAALREAGVQEGADLSVGGVELGAEAPEVLLGVDPAGHPHLLIPVAAPGPEGHEVEAVVVSHRRLRVNGSTTVFVDVTCPMPQLAEVFDHFAVAVIDRISSDDRHPAQVVLDVLEAWRRFLVAGSVAVSVEAMAPLFGELLVLIDIVRRDPRRRIDCWVGPRGARHDIRRDDTAVEVKTTRSHTAREVTIHGHDQLLEPDEGRLFLHFLRLEQTPGGGQAVTDLVHELLQLGVNAGEVFDVVSLAGLAPGDYGEAETVRFTVLERLTFPVTQQFPRIVPATFLGGAPPDGVRDLVYRIDLDHAMELTASEATLNELLDELAGGP